MHMKGSPIARDLATHFRETKQNFREPNLSGMESREDEPYCLAMTKWFLLLDNYAISLKLKTIMSRVIFRFFSGRVHQRVLAIAKRFDKFSLRTNSSKKTCPVNGAG